MGRVGEDGGLGSREEKFSGGGGGLWVLHR